MSGFVRFQKLLRGGSVSPWPLYRLLGARLAEDVGSRARATRAAAALVFRCISWLAVSKETTFFFLVPSSSVFVHLVINRVRFFPFFPPSCTERRRDTEHHRNKTRTAVSLKGPGALVRRGASSYRARAVRFEPVCLGKGQRAKPGQSLPHALPDRYELKCHKVQPLSCCWVSFLSFLKLSAVTCTPGMLLSCCGKASGLHRLGKLRLPCVARAGAHGPGAAERVRKGTSSCQSVECPCLKSPPGDFKRYAVQISGGSL